MKITSIELRHLKLPLVYFFETSFGRVYEQETLIVIIKSQDGLIGYGEVPASNLPYYSYETVQTAWHIIKDLLAPIIFQFPNSDFRLLTPDFSRIRGHHMAKHGVESALWDLKAKQQGHSLSQVYGGKKKTIPAGISLGIDISLSQLLRRIDAFSQRGYRRIKIKIKRGWDIAVIKEIRHTFPKMAFSIDANGAYALKDWKLFKEIDKYKLLMIEQPFSYDDLVDHSILQKKITTPICLDESIRSFHDAEQAIKLKSCRIINLKPARVGGPSQAKMIHDLCAKKRIPVWCGGLLETGIGRAHNIALASLPNFTLPNDISASERYYKQDIIDPPVTIGKNGMIKVPDKPGLGFKVNMTQVDKYTIKKETIQ